MGRRAAMISYLKRNAGRKVGKSGLGEMSALSGTALAPEASLKRKSRRVFLKSESFVSVPSLDRTMILSRRSHI